MGQLRGVFLVDRLDQRRGMDDRVDPQVRRGAVGGFALDADPDAHRPLVGGDHAQAGRLADHDAGRLDPAVDQGARAAETELLAATSASSIGRSGGRRGGPGRQRVQHRRALGLGVGGAASPQAAMVHLRPEGIPFA